MSSRIVIVGGGLAGLAAAVALTERGFPCTLLESRLRLGGRASSFLDPTTGLDVDNCQHVSMGCCTNFQHFCQTTGLAEYFHREPALNFIGLDGKNNRFQAGLLPAPLHLARAFAGLSYLTWSDKISLANGLKALARPVTDDEESQPFSDWLSRHRQSDAAIQRFWLVVLVSALSETLDRISVRHARKVFVDGFLRNRHGWYVDIPTVPLETLYGGWLTDWLMSHGATVRLQTSAEKLELNETSVTGIRLSSQDLLPADEVIVAVPFFRVKSLLPESFACHPSLSGIDALEPAPISSIHLWFDRPITPLRHAVLIDRLCHWVFNRTAIGTDTGAFQGTSGANSQSGDKGYYYQVVISASYGLSERGKEVVLQDVLQDLAGVWPVAAEAKLLHSRQVTEHRAVFSPVPNVDHLRPAQQSPITNLQWAGDWTQTGWPATMEGAVRSGYLAASNVLKRLGRHDSVVQPDLPTSWLSRWLFGLS